MSTLERFPVAMHVPVISKDGLIPKTNTAEECETGNESMGGSLRMRLRE